MSELLRRALAGALTLMLGVLLAACGTTQAAHPAKRMLQKVAGRVSWSHLHTISATLALNDLPPVRTAEALDFLSTSIGFAAGAQCHGGTQCTGFVLATNDRGTDWSMLAPLPEPIFGVRFLTTQDGFVWGATGLYGTRDGGRTWSMLVKGSIYFASFAGQTGWVGVGGFNCATQGCPLRIVATSDGGQQWRTVAYNSLPAPPSDGGTAGATLPWAEYGGGGILKNGAGYVWTSIPAVTFLRTTDGGSTWHATIHGFSPQSTFSVRSSGIGWAVVYPQAGTNGPSGVFRTTDGGAVWQRQGPPPQPWTVASTAANGTLWLLRVPAGAGAYHIAAPWQAPSSQGAAPEGENFTSLDPLSAGSAFATVSAPLGSYVMRTENAGVSWTVVLSLSAPPVPSQTFSFWNQQDGYGFGSAANPSDLLATQDGGTTWSVQGTLPQGFSGQGGFFDAEHGWLLAASGDAWVTKNGGQIWQPISVPGTGPGGVSEIVFTDPKDGFAIFGNLDAQSLNRTSDGGSSWQVLRWSASSVAFATAQDGWLLSGGSPRTLYRTVNGGNTWRTVLEGIPANYSTVETPPGVPNTLWLWDPTQARLSVSVDAGKTFSESVLPAATLSSLQGAPVPLSETTGLVEMEGALWRTRDAGARWTAIAETLSAP